jgi:hypothetical protein
VWLAEWVFCVMLWAACKIVDDAPT